MKRPISCLLQFFLCQALLLLPAGGGGLPADDTGLIGHWKLAGDARDHSGNGRDGVNHGADLKAEGPDGRPSGAAQFDGRDDFIEVPAARSLRPGSHDFSISLWLNPAEGDSDVPGDIISQYDPLARRGFSLGLVTNAGVTTSQANYRNVQFGIDQGRIESKWTNHGRPGKAVLVFALAVHRGALYAGTCESGRDQSGHVFRFDGDAKWTDCGSPDPCNSVSSLAVYQGELYAGVSKYRLGGSSLTESENPHLGGKVYRCAGDRQWVDCGQLAGAEAIGGLVVYRGQLYASSLYKPAGFFRYEGGREWKALVVPSGKRVEAMCVYNGDLFASSYDEGHVFRYDGRGWTDCGQVGDEINTQTYSLAIYAGQLYVGTWRSGKVYRYLADNQWEDTGQLGEELEVMGMLVHNGQLFAGTLPLAEVYRFDGPASWRQVGRLDLTPEVKYRRAWTMALYQGRMFCGTLPSGHVLSIEAGRNVTYDDELRPGWGHLVALRNGPKLKLFIDGKLAGTSAAFEPADFDLSCERPLRIGAGPGDYFRGRLRDLRVYNRALTDFDIAAMAGVGE
jgi:hypothetical protein